MKSSLLTVLGLAILLGGSPASTRADTILVTVNNTPILEKHVLEEIDTRIDAQAVQSAAKGMTYDESSRPNTRAFLRDDVLHMMIERQLIADQLKADKIEISESDVQERFLKEAAERNQTPEQAELAIKEQGQQVEAVKEGFRQTMGVERLYAAHAQDQMETSEAQARQFYDENPHYFEEPELRRVSRILFRLAPDATAQVKETARVQAEAVLTRIQSGEDFAALAKTFSQDDITKPRGGDRGWSPRGWITSADSDPFGNVAFAMKDIGQVSDVVLTQDGYDIIKLTGLKNAAMPTFEEVKPRIMRDFRFRKIGAFWDKYSNELWKTARIEWSPDEKIRQAKKTKEEEEFQKKMETENARDLSNPIDHRPG